MIPFKKVDRPKGLRPGTYPYCFSVTLTKELNDRLLAVCAKNDLDKTAVVRACLARLLPKIEKGKK